MCILDFGVSPICLKAIWMPRVPPWGCNIGNWLGCSPYLCLCTFKPTACWTWMSLVLSGDFFAVLVFPLYSPLPQDDASVVGPDLLVSPLHLQLFGRNCVLVVNRQELPKMARTSPAPACDVASARWHGHMHLGFIGCSISPVMSGNLKVQYTMDVWPWFYTWTFPEGLRLWFWTCGDMAYPSLFLLILLVTFICREIAEIIFPSLFFAVSFCEWTLACVFLCPVRWIKLPQSHIW